MRLLLVTDRFPPDIGGVATSSQRTANALRRLGHEVEVLAQTRAIPGGLVETLETEQSLRVHRLGSYRDHDQSQLHAESFFEWRHAEARFDALWGHYLLPSGFLAVFLAKLHGLSSVVSARGNDVDRLVHHPGDFARLKWTLDHATAVSSVSESLARRIRVVARDGLVVHPVPNSVDLDVFESGAPDLEWRASLGIANDELVLGFSGELRHKKGLSHLLDALVQVRATRPACLLVIGEVRPREMAELSAFAAREREAASRIVVTGHLESPADVARAYRLIDVFLVPSLWDGLPNALLEAMACERVVVASDAGAIPEVVEHTVSGFVVPRPTLHRLGEAILELASLDPERRKEIGLAARARVAARFTPREEDAALRAVMASLSP